MKVENKVLVFILIIALVFATSSCVFADDTADAMSTIDNGTVSGDAQIVSENPFDNQEDGYCYGDLNYTIPENTTEVVSAKVIVNSYSGSGSSETYALHSNVTLTTPNGAINLGYENLTYHGNQMGDENVYVINDHTTKQYSDYQYVYDITSNINGLSPGSNINIFVNNTPLGDYNFDGRIKTIALFIAYDDGDNDQITYWLNLGQSWTQGTRSNVINTNYNGNKTDAIFDTISLSSYNGVYKFNNNILYDPITEISGHYYLRNAWNVNETFNSSSNVFEYTADSQGYSSFKSNVQLLKVISQPEEILPIASSTTKTEYRNTVYAGINNTVTVTVNNIGVKTGKNIKVKLMEGDRVIGTYTIDDFNETTYKITFIDPLIRPVTENTQIGINNSNVTYTVVIEDSNNNVINETNTSFVVLYTGYLGHDLEYPASNGTVVRTVNFTGDIIIMSAGKYRSVYKTDSSAVYELNYTGDVVEAYLYIPYNWDHNPNMEDYKTWNVTFNNQTITPIGSEIIDKANIGGYANYAYGLTVYNITDLVQKGNNTFYLQKLKYCALYPTSLVLFTNDSNNKNTVKTAYMIDNTDILYKDFLINHDLISYSFFNGIDTEKIVNSTLYVTAGSGENGDGNIIFNNQSYENVWKGGSQSFNITNYTVTDYIKENNTVEFVGTGSTVVAYYQLLVIERETDPMASTNASTEYKNTVYAGVNNTVTVTVNNNGNKNAKNVTVKLMEGDRVIGSYVIENFDEDKYTFNFVDTLIRPITENTVNGANNTNVSYRVIVYDNESNVINSTDYKFTLLYNGNLGKDLEYPASNGTVVRTIDFTGDSIILTNGSYLAGSSTGTTTVYNLVYNGTVKNALLYISYNWDKASYDYKTWNITFNNQNISPIAHYRDQSNLGSYGTRGYGLVVYNVTDLIKEGDNTLVLEKISGNSAIYPSTLIVFTDIEGVNTYKTAYISENADLLSKSYNKNIDTKSYTIYNDINTKHMINSTLYVFAASAQAGDGYIIFNNETYNNIWNGTSNSADVFITNINNTITNDNVLSFVSTNSTILALQQMIIVEKPIANVSIDSDNLVLYYRNGSKFTAKLLDPFGNPMANETIVFSVCGKNYTKVTNENGVASLNINLNPRTYAISTTYLKDNICVKNNITVLSTIIAKDIVKYYKNGTQYYVKYLDLNGNPLVNGKVSITVAGKTYNRTTDANGMAKLNINLLPRTYSISTVNPLNNQKITTKITVKTKLITSNLKAKSGKTSYFKATVLNNVGKKLSNAKVTFKVKGKTYVRTTNKYGIAQLAIKLKRGTYTILTSYGGLTNKNKIYVRS